MPYRQIKAPGEGPDVVKLMRDLQRALHAAAAESCPLSGSMPHFVVSVAVWEERFPDSPPVVISSCRNPDLDPSLREQVTNHAAGAFMDQVIQKVAGDGRFVEISDLHGR